MGSDGAGPKPYTQRQARTIFLRVHHSEYALITSGRKTEFRGSPRRCSQLWDVEPPLPVVTWTLFPARGYKRELMVLEETWREPLGSITEESLRREGQPDIAHFRRYWMAREHDRFKPTRMVSVFRIRPWQAHDGELLGQHLLQRLYGEFFPA